MKAPQIFSFFSGIGFLDLGFEKAGFVSAFVNEFDLDFLHTYQYARKQMNIQPPLYGYLQGSAESVLTGKGANNFKKIFSAAQKNGSPVGFIGGPPCPDFSVGGKNRGKTGSNGRLTQVYADIICQYKPDFFVFENVKGLWRTKIHRAFYEEIKKQFESNGYVLFERLINALEYGAPQDRERIILIGFNKKSKIFKNLPKEMPWNSQILFTREQVKKQTWPDTESPKKDRTAPNGIIKSLTVQYWFDKNRVLSHPNQAHCFTPRSALNKFKTIPEGDVSKKSFKRLHRWRYSPTAAYGNNEVHIHPYEARRISAAEALAIQSLPKEFVLPPDMSLSDMFKTIGNGVPYKAAYGIAKTILEFINYKYEDNSGKYCKSNK